MNQEKINILEKYNLSTLCCDFCNKVINVGKTYAGDFCNHGTSVRITDSAIDIKKIITTTDCEFLIHFIIEDHSMKTKITNFRKLFDPPYESDHILFSNINDKNMTSQEIETILILI